MRHILSWVFVIFILQILSPFGGGILSEIIGNILIFSNYIAVYYFICLVAFNFYYKRQYFIFFSLIIISYLFYSTYYYIAGKFILPFFGGESNLVEQPFWIFIKRSVLFFFLVVISAIAYYYNRISRQKIYLKNQKDKLLIERELNYLKNQFDYHLTFNFLNYLYSQVNKTSGDIGDSIEAYSDLLRFYLNINPNEKILLSDEIDIVNNYLHLKATIFGINNLKIKISGDTNEKYIVPGLIIVFLEDFFNREILKFSEIKPEIFLNTETHYIESYIQITKKNIFGDSYKFGENLDQTLNLFYPGLFELKLLQQVDYHTIYLKINGLKNN
jgi:hypothetical protein